MLNHPHIHVLITDGGFLKDGTFRHMLYWDTDKLEELFRAEVFRLLIEKDLIGRRDRQEPVGRLEIPPAALRRGSRIPKWSRKRSVDALPRSTSCG